MLVYEYRDTYLSMMKDSVILILGFCIVETFGSIAYKAKFIGHVKVTGDSQLVYALSLTHCLAQCNKDANCDAIDFNDEVNKCRLFRRCAPTRVQMTSDHHYFFSKRPPISNFGYMYEARSDSCVKLTDTESEYTEAEKSCEHDEAYLSSLNTPELIAMASELLAFRNRTEAWVSPLSDTEKHSVMSRTKKVKRKRRVRRKLPLPTCRILKADDRVRESTSCQIEKKYGICQLPIY